MWVVVEGGAFRREVSLCVCVYEGELWFVCLFSTRDFSSFLGRSQSCKRVPQFGLETPLSVSPYGARGQWGHVLCGNGRPLLVRGRSIGQLYAAVLAHQFFLEVRQGSSFFPTSTTTLLLTVLAPEPFSSGVVVCVLCRLLSFGYLT